MTHRPIWGGNGRLYWVRCTCGSWQSGAYRQAAEMQWAYGVHLTRLVHTG